MKETLLDNNSTIDDFSNSIIKGNNEDIFDPNFSSLKLLKNKTDSTKWDKGYSQKIRDCVEKSHYELFPKSSHTVFYFEKADKGDKKKTIKSSIFVSNNPKNVEYGALVSSRRYTTHVGNHRIKGGPVSSVSVATYLLRDDKILLINNFDVLGYNIHSNDLSVYNDKSKYEPEEKKLYKKYFKQMAGHTHFHFNTIESVNTATRANAIDLHSLISYLKDLFYTPNSSPLNRYDLSMPFLAIKKGEINYESKMVKCINEILNDNKVDDDIKFELTKLKHKKVETGIRKVLRDVDVLNKIIDNCSNNPEIVEKIAYQFMASMSQIELNYNLKNKKEIKKNKKTILDSKKAKKFIVDENFYSKKNQKNQQNKNINNFENFKTKNTGIELENKNKKINNNQNVGRTERYKTDTKTSSVSDDMPLKPE